MVNNWSSLHGQGHQIL